MKPHPKLRRRAKWAGAALTLLLVACWALSVCVRAEWSITDEWTLFVGGGSVGATRDPAGSRLVDTDFGGRPGFYAGATWPPEKIFSWFDIQRGRDFSRTLIPGWALLAPVLLITAAVWRLDRPSRRRVLAGQCWKCGYDLSATPAGAKCPECGKTAGQRREWTPHPRIRKTVKWAGLVLSLVLAVAWVGSAWCEAGIGISPKAAVVLNEGQLRILVSRYEFQNVNGGETFFNRHAAAFRWWFKFSPHDRPSYWAVPVWAFVLLTSGASALAWRLDVRARQRAAAAA